MTHDEPTDYRPNTELEQIILGNVLIDNARFHEIGHVITKDHFHDPLHGRIWAIVADRIAKGHVASPVTLKGDLEAA